MKYIEKYFKYKTKYLNLKKQIGSNLKYQNLVKSESYTTNFLKYYESDQLIDRDNVDVFDKIYWETRDNFASEPINFFENLAKAWIKDHEEEASGIGPEFTLALCSSLNNCEQINNVPKEFFKEAAARDMIIDLINSNLQSNSLSKLKQILKKNNLVPMTD